MTEDILYKRNAKGDIIRWSIYEDSNGSLITSYGILGKKTHIETINPTLVKGNELKSRVNAKRKEGYKNIFEIHDNAPNNIADYNTLYNYLNTYLPKYSTTSEGFILPMLSKTLEDSKPFEKFGTMLGQWKINGLRCIVGAEKSNDLFAEIKFTFHSREGVDWSSNFEWLGEIIKENLDKNILDLMIEEGVCLDGELYLPGYSVNDINSFIKNKSLHQHYLLQFWCYDLCMENSSAYSRRNILNSRIINIEDESNNWDKYSHLNNKSQFIIIPSFEIMNYNEAVIARNNFIDSGFEGLILRNPNAEYAFGKRNSSMFKFKKILDGIFKILHVGHDKRGLPIFTLCNDINEETFECTWNADRKSSEFVLRNKDFYINKSCLVEYRERSGVKQVPFHAKIIDIYV